VSIVYAIVFVHVKTVMRCQLCKLCMPTCSSAMFPLPQGCWRPRGGMRQQRICSLPSCSTHYRVLEGPPRVGADRGMASRWVAVEKCVALQFPNEGSWHNGVLMIEVLGRLGAAQFIGARRRGLQGGRKPCRTCRAGALRKFCDRFSHIFQLLSIGHILLYLSQHRQPFLSAPHRCASGDQPLRTASGCHRMRVHCPP